MSDLNTEFFDRYPKCFPDGDTLCWSNAGQGWWPLLHELFSAIERLELPSEFRIDQVKQKFRGLRVYTSAHVDEVEQLIKVAEQKAWGTCELCGGEVTDVGAGWGMNLCNECEESRK